MSRKPPAPSIFRVLNEIGIIEQLATHRMESCLPHGLKISQFSVLNHFVRLDVESTPSKLASAFQVTKGAMTNTVSRLHALGFVDVVPDSQDGRSKIVRITDAGRVAHRDSVMAIAPDLKLLENALGGEAFEAALPFLEQLRVFMDENR